jgi:hypothetical protein
MVRKWSVRRLDVPQPLMRWKERPPSTERTTTPPSPTAMVRLNAGVRSERGSVSYVRTNRSVDVVPAAAQPDERVGAGGLTREVETPLPSNSPHDHMILRVDLVGSHGRWKRPCLQTAHMTI